MTNVVLRIAGVAAACLIGLVAERASADVILSVNSGSMQAGGALSLDVVVSDTSPTEGIAEMALVLEITPLTDVGDSSLNFVNPQSEAYLEEADYVFFDNSDVVLNPGDPVATVGPFGQVVEFFDLTFDFNNELASPGKVLATIQLQHLLGGESIANVIGDEFEIAVNTDFTEFFNAAGDPVFVDLAGTTSGMVTITAIPEPSTLGLLAIATTGFVLRRRRH
ncbi:PEP-CTERM sorting domain-containing protein [Roseiconus lacunae]|uniref:PEP-CTERM sorting domain-containing protein n=1 Tax=Roseiconus lacunae TaxID=2605694 RepID=UPI001E55A83A|nr:PEP-CTERM sorting domain-containing protein [Roseiconus lacunae]MCD0459897.1 PEP-CTERM sorting domain-containing protein [Roseiconus lacunae]